MCFLDGNDIGEGAYNLYLYTQDVSGTVAMLIRLEKTGRLPSGLRIAVAKYTDEQHKNWTYEPVYPENLTKFGLAYPPSEQPR